LSALKDGKHFKLKGSTIKKKYLCSSAIIRYFGITAIIYISRKYLISAMSCDIQKNLNKNFGENENDAKNINFPSCLHKQPLVFTDFFYCEFAFQIRKMVLNENFSVKN
jgi:hypothetical protein